MSYGNGGKQHNTTNAAALREVRAGTAYQRPVPLRHAGDVDWDAGRQVI